MTNVEIVNQQSNCHMFCFHNCWQSTSLSLICRIHQTGDECGIFVSLWQSDTMRLPVR